MDRNAVQERAHRTWRRFLLLVGAALLLWFGLGNPFRPHPRYEAAWLEADGIRTRALRAGRGDTTLVFLHGFGESLLSWRPILDRFTSHYHVLAVDLPGFGLADKPDSGYDYPRYRRWLEALLTRYTTGPLVLVGHSMGGQLAAGYAHDAPQRAVAAILLDPAGHGLNPDLMDSAGFAAPSTHWITSALPWLLPVHDSTWMRESPEMMAYEPLRDSAAARAARSVLRQFDFTALTGEFASIRQPVLLIWGSLDQTIPLETGDSIAAKLPCRQYVVLNTMHRPHQTVADTAASVMLSFLRKPGCAN
ncbi:MAG TPA: alpha/beta hydrolase [Gemmatimonadales bacterium]|nr:alpha/beta hydrolase [Gemmatimonadales bacterium]